MFSPAHLQCTIDRFTTQLFWNFKECQVVSIEAFCKILYIFGHFAILHNFTHVSQLLILHILQFLHTNFAFVTTLHICTILRILQLLELVIISNVAGDCKNREQSGSCTNQNIWSVHKTPNIILRKLSSQTERLFLN